MAEVSKIAHKYRAPIYVHNSETKAEVNECIKKYGKTPTELFEQLNLYDYGGAGFHAIYLGEKDMEIFKERNLYAVINAGSNAKLDSEIAPVERYRKYGINLSMGTDGASSNDALDFFRQMYLISILQKLVESDSQKDGQKTFYRWRLSMVYISDKLTILHGQSDHLSRRFRSLISERDSRRSKSFL